jgi:N,N'-diacetyllegionaminate synthase
MRYIAELGQTHEGDIETAIAGIEAFASAGATDVKFQWLTPTGIARSDAPRYWATGEDEDDQHDVFARGVIPYTDWSPIIQTCHEQGVGFLTTPFDLEAVGAMKGYGLTEAKIASGDITNRILLQAVAESMDHVFLSTGGANITEIQHALSIFESHDCEVTLLACTLSYPTEPEAAYVGRIERLDAMIQRIFVRGVGYSDHTLGFWSAGAATAAGAIALEKHCSLGGDPAVCPDHEMALSPDEFAEYVKLSKYTALAFADSSLETSEVERAAVHGARRSLVLTRDVDAGEILDDRVVVALRPGPVDDEVGAGHRWKKDTTALEDLTAGTVLRYSHFA